MPVYTLAEDGKTPVRLTKEEAYEAHQDDCICLLARDRLGKAIINTCFFGFVEPSDLRLWMTEVVLPGDDLHMKVWRYSSHDSAMKGHYEVYDLVYRFGNWHETWWDKLKRRLSGFFAELTKLHWSAEHDSFYD